MQKATLIKVAFLLLIMKDHVDKENVTKRYPLLTNGGLQKVNIINESGLYSLIQNILKNT